MEDLRNKILSRQGYNLGGRARNAAAILAGQSPQENIEETEDDLLKRLVLRNQAMTTDPNFQTQLAQTKANMSIQSGLDLEDAKLNRKRNAYADATSQPLNPPAQIAPAPAVPSERIGNKSTERVPVFVPKPSTKKYDPSLQMMVDEPGGYIQNPDKINPSVDAVRSKNLVSDARLSIDRALSMAFPDGTSKSYRRDIAKDSNQTFSHIPMIGRLVPQVRPDNPHSDKDDVATENAQSFNRNLKNAIAARRYLETGQAVNESELRDLLMRFGVSEFSSPQSAYDAMVQLKNYLYGYEEDLAKGGIGDGPGPQTDPAPRIPKFGSDKEAIQYAKKTGYKGIVLVNGEEVEIE